MATYAVDIYKGSIKLGSGTADDASTSITSYSGTAPVNGRNVRVVRTASTNAGKSYPARVLSGSGTSTLVMNCKCDYL